MKKYAKIANEQTKQCDVGIGNYTGYYKSIGMTEMDVEQAYNGIWYLAGCAPEKPQEIKEQEVRQVRNSYLVDFVDPYQLVLRWGELSETEQGYMREYRQYLLDYTKGNNWWEQNPMNYEDWLVAHHPVDNDPETDVLIGESE